MLLLELVVLEPGEGGLRGRGEGIPHPFSASEIQTIGSSAVRLNQENGFSGNRWKEPKKLVEEHQGSPGNCSKEP